MTRLSTRKTVPDSHWNGRLREAKDYLDAARRLIEASSDSDNGNPILSLITTAAIGFGDALTACRAGVVNQQDHAAATKLLRDVLRSSLPDEQERNFVRLLGKKDEIQYGIRATPMPVARLRLEDLESFAQWANEILSPRPSLQHGPR